MNFLRDIRVIPVVLIAISGLAVLKISGLVLGGAYVFDYNPNTTKSSWAQDMLNFPGGKREVEITGSVPKKKEEPAAPPAVAPAQSVKVAVDAPSPTLPSERGILEKLQERRHELDTRAREIEIRESLLKAAERRMETRAVVLKGEENRLGSVTQQKQEAEAARFKGIVTMYESMKPKDAAKIFDRLEMPVLFEIASQIAPRKMSDIMGLMAPEAAEKLTVELARRAIGTPGQSNPSDLPKIEGKPIR